MALLSGTLARIAPSPTITITQAARERRAAGQDVISLSAGEPDFDTPDHIKAAAKAAIDRGETGYTAPDGIFELKRAIVAKFRRENAIDVGADQISVGAGGKQVLYNAMAATLDPGDEVVIAAPYWVSYPDIVRLCGGVPVIVPAGAGLKLDASALAGAITPATKWVILNSPANPTGASYSAAEIEALLGVLRPHPSIHVLADDIYEHIVYDGFAFATPAGVASDMADRILTLNGVSKAYAMTGWRIGYAAGPPPLIDAMRKVQSQTTSCPASISQWAAVAALDGPQEGLAARRATFSARRDRLVGALRAVPGLDCTMPQGAFYLYPSCVGVIGRVSPRGRPIPDDTAFAAALLEETGVAVVPGAAFGSSPAVRISYAAADDALAAGAERIGEFCEALR